MPRTGGHLPKRLHWNQNCSRFLRCSHGSPCSGAGEGAAEEGRRAGQSCRMGAQSQVSWLQGLAGNRSSSLQPPCHLSKILRQCSGLRKPRGVLCSLLQDISFQCPFFFFKSLLSIFFTILFLFHVLFFLSLRHMGSELPDQGWDPRPRRWKGNPTTGLSRKFPSNVFSPTSVQGWESGWRKHTTSLSLQHPKHEPHSGKATSHLELEV